ncbi:MAG TPA: Npt1/Npt2 family nucleotide transporter [Candidatus Binatia bacterium]
MGISDKTKESRASDIGELLAGSRYLKTIAILIFVSVIVSTLLDFQFKSAAKQAYPSGRALTVFFSSYYGWLSVATFFVQVVLTGKILTMLALKASLYVTPGSLFIGSVAIIIWPGLVTVVLTRMADAALHESIYRSGIESLYMLLSASVKKTVKAFLNVVFERIGDATAGFIILMALSVTASSLQIPSIHLCRSDRFLDTYDRTSVEPGLGTFARRIKVGEIVQADQTIRSLYGVNRILRQLSWRATVMMELREKIPPVVLRYHNRCP